MSRALARLRRQPGQLLAAGRKILESLDRATAHSV